MDEMSWYNKHYITVDDNGLVIDGFSDAFRKPSETDICINEQGGYQFRLYANGPVNPPLRDSRHMIPLYRYENGQIIERTRADIDADIAARPSLKHTPTIAERVSELENENAFLKAQIDAQSEQMDFYEDCIAEMALVVYA